ncbi:DUF4097 family beta strand repeat-containing protein [Bdellovibrio sp. GT3]|uniref:DUF4097 family beta strand repeat-containing protein n=1 Tax=Bdellovibrio sp. GT3 TaxID=3136282 RepID=UPI0030F05C47
MSAITVILISLFVQPLWAATFEAPVQEGTRLVIKGLDAQVQLVAAPGANSVKISGVEESGFEGAYVVTKKENIIEVSMNEFGSKKTWMNILPKASSQAKKIEISGAAVPVEVQLKSGSVVAQRWSKDLKVSMTSGRVATANGTGTLQLYVQKGEISVADHVGRVNADGYSGAMNLKNIQGDVDASMFSGQLNLEKVRGFVSLTTQQATGKVNQGSGTIQFENGKGSLSLQAFQGRLEGQNQDGNVTINMTLDSEVDVKSKAGRVNIISPAASGASVNLYTVDGEIFVPNELRVSKLSSEKSVRGRLRGTAQRGSISVRGQETTIQVK